METLGHLWQACRHVHFDPSVFLSCLHEEAVMT